MKIEHANFMKLLSLNVEVVPAGVDAPLRLTTRHIPWLHRYIPAAVQPKLRAGHSGHLAEIRQVSVVFSRYAGIDLASSSKGSCAEAIEKGHRLMLYVQRAIYTWEGSINKFLVDDKGLVVLAVFGLPPMAHADDPKRAVAAAKMLVDDIAELGPEVSCSAGVASGLVFCGVVGSTIRREYTVMGRVVNLAARLMGKAGSNQVLVDDSTKQKSEAYLEFEPINVGLLKGVREPVVAHSPTAVKKPTETKKSALQLEARQAEVEQLRQLVHDNSRPNATIVLTGERGSGKTVVVDQLPGIGASAGFLVLLGHNKSSRRGSPVPAAGNQESDSGKAGKPEKSEGDKSATAASKKDASPPPAAGKLTDSNAEQGGLAARGSKADSPRRISRGSELSTVTTVSTTDSGVGVLSPSKDTTSSTEQALSDHAPEKESTSSPPTDTAANVEAIPGRSASSRARQRRGFATSADGGKGPTSPEASTSSYSFAIPDTVLEDDSAVSSARSSFTDPAHGSAAMTHMDVAGRAVPASPRTPPRSPLARPKNRSLLRSETLPTTSSGTSGFDTAEDLGDTAETGGPNAAPPAPQSEDASQPHLAESLDSVPHSLPSEVGARTTSTHPRPRRAMSDPATPISPLLRHSTRRRQMTQSLSLSGGADLPEDVDLGPWRGIFEALMEHLHKLEPGHDAKWYWLQALPREDLPHARLLNLFMPELDLTPEDVAVEEARRAALAAHEAILSASGNSMAGDDSVVPIHSRSGSLTGNPSLSAGSSVSGPSLTPHSPSFRRRHLATNALPLEKMNSLHRLTRLKQLLVTVLLSSAARLPIMIVLHLQTGEKLG